MTTYVTPRRFDRERLKPSEQLIHQAMHEVEKLGADERLTKAVVFLMQAKNLVSDYIDDVKIVQLNN